MSEWWETTHALLIAQNITRADITHAVKGGHFAFRQGVGEMMEGLAEQEVPLLVFSAGLEQDGCAVPNTATSARADSVCGLELQADARERVSARKL
eukprot:3477693-Rhodomonas_salina.1